MTEASDNTSTPFVLATRSKRESGARIGHTYQMRHGEDLLMHGHSQGRYLMKSAAFSRSDGSPWFRIVAARRLLPRTWVLEAPDGQIRATLRLMARNRGGAVIEDHRSGRRFELKPNVTTGRDLVRALVLLDTTVFELTEGDRLIGVIGKPATESASRLMHSLARTLLESVRTAGFRDQEALTLVATDEPNRDLIAAILVFKNQVIDSVRSP